MRPDEYDGHDGTALAALVRAGEVTAGELLDAALARHQATDAAIGAVVHVQDGVARSAIAAGLPDGPFTGVPFLVKDLGCEAIDLPTSMGSRVFDGYCYTYDSEIYVRLRAAGLVTFARTTTPEFGVGVTTESVVYGRPTRNPWDLGHVAGGSSGGAGAAVAAGVVPMAHGSDGGGSVRRALVGGTGSVGPPPVAALLKASCRGAGKDWEPFRRDRPELMRAGGDARRNQGNRSSAAMLNRRARNAITGNPVTASCTITKVAPQTAVTKSSAPSAASCSRLTVMR